MGQEAAAIIKQLVEQAREFRYGTGHVAKDEIGKVIEALTPHLRTNVNLAIS